MGERRQPAVFLDRDGILIEEVGYLRRVEDLRLLPGVPEAVRRLNEAGLPVLVVTNQSVVARGLCTEADVTAIHTALAQQLQDQGAHIDRFYYCPHHPSEGRGVYRMACKCRKPRSGLVYQAAQELHLRLSRSVVVGDKLSDLEAAWEAGCRAVLVLTGYGQETLKSLDGNPRRPDYIAEDLGGAVDWIVRSGSCVLTPQRLL